MSRSPGDHPVGAQQWLAGLPRPGHAVGRSECNRESAARCLDRAYIADPDLLILDRPPRRSGHGGPHQRAGPPHRGRTSVAIAHRLSPGRHEVLVFDRRRIVNAAPRRTGRPSGVYADLPPWVRLREQPAVRGWIRRRAPPQCRAGSSLTSGSTRARLDPARRVADHRRQHVLSAARRRSAVRWAANRSSTRPGEQQGSSPGRRVAVDVRPFSLAGVRHQDRAAPNVQRRTGQQAAVPRAPGRCRARAASE